MKKKKSKSVKNDHSNKRGKYLFLEIFTLTKQRQLILCIVGGIFILRLIYLLQLSKNDPLFYHPLPGTDQYMYWEAAREILAGESLKGAFYYNPLYYYWFAFSLWFTNYSLFGVRILQVLLDVGTCILIYLTSKRLFNYQVGLIGLILGGICGTLIFYSSVLLSTNISTFLSIASLYFLIRLKDRFNKRDLIIAGIFLGLACLSQPNTILFLPFVLLWLFFVLPVDKKKAIWASGGFLIVVMLTISPVTVKNYLSSGKFILLTTSAPFNLWKGNNEHAPGWEDLCQPYLGQLEEKAMKENKDIGNLYMEDILRFMREKPLGYIKLLGKKFLLFWGNWDIPHQVGYDDTKKYASILNILPDFSLIAILGLTGIMLSIKDFKRLLLLPLFIIIYSFSVILVLVVGRYRPPVLPPLIIFSAFTLWWGYKKFYLRKYQQLLLSLIIVGIFSTAVYSQAIIDQIHMIKHPYGQIQPVEGGVVVTDNSNRDNRGFAIDSDKKMIKKEIIITTDLSKVKAVYLNLTYNCGQEGRLMTTFNDHALPILEFKSLYEAVRGIVGQVSLGPINASILKKGVNTITLQVKDNGYINIPIDACYNYGRSYFSMDNGKMWKKEKGEYKIELKLISKDLP
ncbi:MAG: glycosyltransferase family 39 protein [bacterium]